VGGAALSLVASRANRRFRRSRHRDSQAAGDECAVLLCPCRRLSPLLDGGRRDPAPGFPAHGSSPTAAAPRQAAQLLVGDVVLPPSPRLLLPFRLAYVSLALVLFDHVRPLCAGRRFHRRHWPHGSVVTSLAALRLSRRGQPLPLVCSGAPALRLS